MDANLKREIILDNYQNPKHKTTPDSNDYVKVNMNSKSCIDEVNVFLKLKGVVFSLPLLLLGEAKPPTSLLPSWCFPHHQLFPFVLLEKEKLKFLCTFQPTFLITYLLLSL